MIEFTWASTRAMDVMTLTGMIWLGYSPVEALIGVEDVLRDQSEMRSNAIGRNIAQNESNYNYDDFDVF